MDVLVDILFWIAVIAGTLGIAWGLVIVTIMYFKGKAEMYVAEKGADALKIAAKIIKDKIK